MQIKLIFTRKVMHLASFCKWGFVELGSGLLLVSRKCVFERRTSTGSEASSFIIWLEATKFVLLSVFTLIETIWPKIWAKPLPMNEKDPLPVDLRRSKTSLLKVSGSDPRDNCGTHFGTNPLIVSKMTNSFCAALQVFLFWEGNSHINQWVFCGCSLVPHDSLVPRISVSSLRDSQVMPFLLCNCLFCWHALNPRIYPWAIKRVQALQCYTYLIAKMVLWRAQIPFFCRWTAVTNLNSLFQILEFFK